MEGGRRTLTCRTWEAPPPLLAQWWSLAQMANVGRLGLAGWRSAIRHPLASPCHCNLLLIPNPTPSHNVEMPLASGSRLRLIFQLELFEAVSLIHPSRPDSEREEKEGKICNLLPLLACWLLLAAVQFYRIVILTVGLHKYKMIAL